jgi:3-deoxy-manno-octulosonate cytidylyltransferase (CMP-KDO synthetase)
MCPLLTETYVATCDQEIFDYICSVGGKAVMTADTHERCSDRTAEAMLKIETEIGGRADIVVMVQGDEPMITPEMIEHSVAPMLKDASIQVVNLMARIHSIEEFEDPNEVKVVTDLQCNALYFSREPIPSRKKDKKDVPMMKQVCIIPFEREFLLKFNALNSTPLEIIESVDMMRVIEHGYQVRMVYSDTETYSVDTPEDLAKVEKLIARDPLLNHYAK